MNILKRELKNGLKTFIYWVVGLFFLVFTGMVKFTGLQGDGSVEITEIFNKFPKIVLSVFGMVDIDITTIGGYYAILSYYTLICVSIYAIALGLNAVNREAIDKTYEFLFTKPRSRSYILTIKLIASAIYILAFSALNYIFSIAAIATLKDAKNINKEILLYSIVIFILGIMFCSIAAFIAAYMKKAEKASLYGNLLFLGAFLTGIIYDMLEDAKFFKIFAPLKYFTAIDLVNNKFDLMYLVICIAITTIAFLGTFRFFNKKDFNFEG